MDGKNDSSRIDSVWQCGTRISCPNGVPSMGISRTSRINAQCPCLRALSASKARFSRLSGSLARCRRPLPGYTCAECGDQLLDDRFRGIRIHDAEILFGRTGTVSVHRLGIGATGQRGIHPTVGGIDQVGQHQGAGAMRVGDIREIEGTQRHRHQLGQAVRAGLARGDRIERQQAAGRHRHLDARIEAGGERRPAGDIGRDNWCQFYFTGILVSVLFRDNWCQFYLIKESQREGRLIGVWGVSTRRKTTWC